MLSAGSDADVGGHSASPSSVASSAGRRPTGATRLLLAGLFLVGLWALTAGTAAAGPADGRSWADEGYGLADVPAQEAAPVVPAPPGEQPDAPAPAPQDPPSTGSPVTTPRSVPGPAGPTPVDPPPAQPARPAGDVPAPAHGRPAPAPQPDGDVLPSGGGVAEPGCDVADGGLPQPPRDLAGLCPVDAASPPDPGGSGPEPLGSTGTTPPAAGTGTPPPPVSGAQQPSAPGRPPASEPAPPAAPAPSCPVPATPDATGTTVAGTAAPLLVGAGTDVPAPRPSTAPAVLPATVPVADRLCAGPAAPVPGPASADPAADDPAPAGSGRTTGAAIAEPPVDDVVVPLADEATAGSPTGTALVGPPLLEASPTPLLSPLASSEARDLRVKGSAAVGTGAGSVARARGPAPPATVSDAADVPLPHQAPAPVPMPPAVPVPHAPGAPSAGTHACSSSVGPGGQHDAVGLPAAVLPVTWSAPPTGCVAPLAPGIAGPVVGGADGPGCSPD